MVYITMKTRSNPLLKKLTAPKQNQEWKVLHQCIAYNMHYIFLEKAFSRDSDKIFYQYLSLRRKGQFAKNMLSIRSKHQQNMRIFLATFWLNHSVLCHSVLWERELIYFILALVFLFCNHVLPLKICRKKCRNYNIIFFWNIGIGILCIQCHFIGLNECLHWVNNEVA